MSHVPYRKNEVCESLVKFACYFSFGTVKLVILHEGNAFVQLLSV